MKHLLFTLFMLWTFLLSCNKYKCDSNCTEIVLKGLVSDQTSAKGFGNIEVQAIWTNYNQSLPYPVIGKTKTKSDGSFEMKVRINPSRFLESALVVKIQCPQTFATSYNFFTNSSNAELSFGQADQSTLQNIHFRLYPKTTTSIRLIRSQSDTFGNFFVEYSFGPNEEIRKLAINKFNSNFSADTTINILTGADIINRFETVKNLVNGQVIVQVDSAKFSKLGSNTFLINY